MCSSRQKALERGARSVKEPYELSDANGTVVLATIQTVKIPVFTVYVMLRLGSTGTARIRLCSAPDGLVV